ncbi:DUF1311 domain-containing protein [Erwinia papayae]|uniref:DUF1311 domain-containing protein n=1 Tax=Erwinia papayae TaxID=206499 RepID=A0ABV3N803_9GAMM
MKKYAAAVFGLSLLYPLTGLADITWGDEWDSCFKKEENPSLSYSCLADKKKASSKQLDELITATVKKIKVSFIGALNGQEEAGQTYGDVFSRRFIKSQNIWKQYRKEFCHAMASQLNEEAWDYQANIDQCEINLNKRHEEEIHLMGLPAAR